MIPPDSAIREDARWDTPTIIPQATSTATSTATAMGTGTIMTTIIRMPSWML